MIIDGHAHIVSADQSAYPIAPLAGDLRPGSLDDPFTVDRLVDALTSNGVDGAVVIQRAHIYGYDNSYVLDSALAHPFLSAVVCLDAQAAEAAVTLTRLVTDRGAVGVRLTVPVGSPHGGTPGTDWFASSEAQSVWRACSELEIPLCLHLFRWNRDEGLHALEALMRQFTEVTVVLDHVGNAEFEAGLAAFPGEEGLLRLAELPRLHIKAAGLNFARLVGAPVSSADLVAYLVRTFGADRVLWGSDVTQTAGSYAELVAQARAAVATLTAADAECVLGRTARALYGAPAPVFP